MNTNLIHGDMTIELPKLPADHFDSCVTDPPYELGFMGKGWDNAGVSFQASTWRHVHRVLKPGAHLLAFGGTRTFHRITCAIEDAGFEIRDCIMWVYGCLDDKTECLTSTGWKCYTEVTTKDLVLQWDSQSDRLTWTQPHEVMVFPYSGKMIRLKNRHTDQCLTPNHRVYARIRKHCRDCAPVAYEVMQADEIKRYWHTEIPMAGSGSGGKVVEHPYVIGWWMTDAWKHGDGKACMFGQSKLRTLEKLRDALRQFSPSEYVREAKSENHNDEHTFYVTGPISEYLLSEFSDRELTWDMLNWSADCRKLLFDGLMDGDGSWNEKGYSGAFWSKRQHRRDVFMALCVSLGYRCYEDWDNYCVYVNVSTGSTQIQSKHYVEPEDYTGDVWCVRVPTGAFVVRRNGKPFITGNSGFPKSLDVSKAIDKAAGAERELVPATGGLHKNANLNDDGWSKIGSDTATMWSTTPATPAAQQWSGWGTALKPAWEIVIVARKPLIGTVAQNVLRYGTGGINVDGCRVGTGGGTAKGSKPQGEGKGIYGAGLHGACEITQLDAGRWPANLIHDGSDEVLAGFPSSNGQQGRVTGDEPSSKTTNTFGEFQVRNPAEPRNDSGSAARFFYCAKASKSDRGTGNTHPTVKPTALMQYLCRLVTQPGGIILDPFMGSGTTGKAAIAEGFNFTGIELNDTAEHPYFTIANSRIVTR